MLRRFRARPVPIKILIALLFVVLLVIAAWFYHRSKNAPPNVHDFDSCVAAGYPILETYPEQCTYQGESYFKPGEAPYDPKDDLRNNP